MHNTPSQFDQEPSPLPYDPHKAQRLVELESIPASLQGAFGESFLGPYAVHLAAPKPLIALLSTIPLLFGSLLQPFALSLMSQFRHRSTLLFVLTMAQACMWFPILGIGFLDLTGGQSGLLLLGLATIYYIVGMMAGPIWNSLIGDLLHPSKRVDCFSRRNLYIGICMLVGFLLGGIILRTAEQHHFVIAGFCSIFILASCGRIASSLLLKAHPDPDYAPPHVDSFSFFEFLERSHESNFLKFVIFVAATNLSIHISAPFVPVYLLRDLGLSYVQYSVIIASGLLFQLLVMRRWGTILQEVGARKVLMISTIGFAFTPFLWLVSSNLIWLSIVFGIRGFLWSGYQLSSSTFLFDAVTPAKRARCAAYQSIVNNSFIVLGSLFGGWIVSVVPRVEGLGMAGLGTDSNILLLFMLSGLINVILLAFLTSFKEVREVNHHPTTSILFHLTYLRPFGDIHLRFGGNGGENGPSTDS